jgi:hypothetical protein
VAGEFSRGGESNRIQLTRVGLVNGEVRVVGIHNPDCQAAL